ncbi:MULTISPECIES: ATP-binding cassette domain-containing protein [unclassified Sporosarcina]|uniref:ATP-binding cassette domain-containing protein n=1 Tax=unclassified Sporosarcina TaxID=2647733 RepID=UPI00203E2498|nr:MULTISPECIES: ATP-binding cassette domain-containing protein [unclassified Sporosarcina]GKV65810.1 ABC transporter [Sporosarcina sp. NCCP-2331]GLB55934.1 ABC transporter [Sporosarcina sp. NCCP-2378]
MLNVRIHKQLAHYEMNIEFEMGNEILVLVGPSGSGKTTILNSVAGLVHPDSGMIVSNERIFFDSYEKPMPARERKIGYLFQDYALFPHMTVEKNIWYGVKKNQRNESKEMIKQLLQVLGIEHLLQKYPHQISGGEKQRVGLARALAARPSVLLLDEPLSALDKETRQQCQDELLRLHDMWKIPFMIVTHDLDEAERLGDRIIYLEQGKIADETWSVNNKNKQL